MFIDWICILRSVDGASMRHYSAFAGMTGGHRNGGNPVVTCRRSTPGKYGLVRPVAPAAERESTINHRNARGIY